MQKQLNHIFSLLLALQVMVASTGATFYKHYCSTEGELMAVSAYATADGGCCTMHDHGKSDHDESHDHENDGCCDLQYEFRKADSAPLAESLKLAIPAMVFALPERLFTIPLPVLQLPDVADEQALADNYSPPLCCSGKSLLPVIQQFRL